MRDSFEDLLGLKRFGDIVRRAVAKCFLGGFDALVAGHDDDGEVWFQFFDLLEYFHAVQFGHFDVEQHEVGGGAFKQLEGFQPVGHKLELILIVEDELE